MAGGSRPFNIVDDPRAQGNFDDLYTRFPLGPQHIGNIPACRVTHSVSQSIPSGTGTALAFDSERYDDPERPMHDVSTNNSRITIAVPGVYAVLGNVRWAAGGSSARECWLWVNGTTAIDLDSTTGSTEVTNKVAAHYRLAVGDYIELVAYQTTGGNLNVTKAAMYSPEFSATWCCP